MLVPAIERDGEDRAGLPLEGDARAGIVPHRGRAAAVEDHDHLLVEMMLRRELLPRRDLADVAVVGIARVLVVDDDAFGVAPRPRLQIDGAQIWDVLRVDDVEALVAHEAHIGRILLGPKLVRQFLGDDEILVLPFGRLFGRFSVPIPGPFAGPRFPPAGLCRRLLVYQPAAASATAGRRNAVAASAKMAGIMSPAKVRKATAVAPKTIPPAALAGGHRSRDRCCCRI